MADVALDIATGVIPVWYCINGTEIKRIFYIIKITEWHGLEETSKITSSNPTHTSGHALKQAPDQVAQGPIQTDLEICNVSVRDRHINQRKSYK